MLVRACRWYLHVADSSLLEGAVLQVVGADVAIFAPVAGKHAANAGSAPERGRERGSERAAQCRMSAAASGGGQAYELSTEQL